MFVRLCMFVSLKRQLKKTKRHKGTFLAGVPRGEKCYKNRLNVESNSGVMWSDDDVSLWSWHPHYQNLLFLAMHIKHVHCFRAVDRWRLCVCDRYVDFEFRLGCWWWCFGNDDENDDDDGLDDDNDDEDDNDDDSDDDDGIDDGGCDDQDDGGDDEDDSV